MPPRKKAPPAPPALTDEDVSALRDRVKAGDRPRVIVRAASAAVPAGTRGNVVRVGNPSDGEFIVVRLGRDEVPFAPSELAVSARGKASAAPAKASTAPAKASAAPAKASAAPAAKAPGKSPAKVPAKVPAKLPAKVTATAPAKAAGSRRPTKRGAGRRPPPPLTVTLRFADGSWSVEASRGARRLARPSPLRPGAVKAFADLVDEASVRDALTETVESCRVVVEQRAAALREQLQAAEVALREYDARRR